MLTRRVDTFGFSVCIGWHPLRECQGRGFPVAIHEGAMVSSIHSAQEGYLNNEHWTFRLDYARV